MADTITAHYSWVKPEISGSPSTWGNKLNSDMDGIDSVVYGIDQSVSALNARVLDHSIVLNKSSVGDTVGLYGKSLTNNRWGISLGDNAAESGSNVGSNFDLWAYDDSGAFLGAVFTAARNRRRIELALDPTNALDAVTKQYADRNGVYIGQIIMYAGNTTPSGFLPCNGGVYANSSIPLLAPILANRFPGGNGSTTSAVPFLANGYGPVGAGGAYTLGTSGGEFTHVLSLSEMAAHVHGVNDPTHTHATSQVQHVHSGVGKGSYNVPAGAGPDKALQSGNSDPNFGSITVTNSNTGISIQSAGSSGAHNNMPPYTAVSFFIRYAMT